MSNESFCIVGLWTDISVRTFKLDGSSLQPACTELVGGEIIPRSVMITDFGEATYAFCALGDGSLFVFLFDVDTGVLTPSKQVKLGTQPNVLNSMVHDGKVHVFASSDRPTVIYLSNGERCLPTLPIPRPITPCPAPCVSQPVLARLPHPKDQYPPPAASTQTLTQR